MKWSIDHRQNLKGNTMQSQAGRPREVSRCAILSPMSEFIDARWGSLGLTNDAAASILGLASPNVISMWRTGRSPVPLARITQIADLMKIDVMVLLALWLKQEVLREKGLPPGLVEAFERRLISENEAEVIAGMRKATRHADPKFRPSQIAAFSAVAVA
ncbi:hypothetical protein [Brevundimonas sp. SL161]|uniref:hypothetical protein n=1 Tax=Brevundimonas sp. SL161 TaxID=2804613 RepID=UPI003CE8747F